MAANLPLCHSFHRLPLWHLHCGLHQWLHWHCRMLSQGLHDCPAAGTEPLRGVLSNGQHHAAGPAPTQEEEQPLLGPATDPHPIKLTSVAWSIRVELVTIFLLYMITMACHPGLTVLIEATGLHNGSATSWEKVYFVPVNCFLCFTV